jgi:hypothetical protein
MHFYRAINDLAARFPALLAGKKKRRARRPAASDYTI